MSRTVIKHFIFDRESQEDFNTSVDETHHKKEIPIYDGEEMFAQAAKDSLTESRQLEIWSVNKSRNFNANYLKFSNFIQILVIESRCSLLILGALG